MERSETEEAEILELYELHYADLILLSSINASSTSPGNLDKVETMTKTIMETLGPRGPGLLAITGVPNASKLRKEFLPLARELALLDHESRKRILKENSLGSDVPLKNPDRSVSSFAMQLKYAKATELIDRKPTSEADYLLHTEDNPQEVDHTMIACHNMKLKNIGSTFKELGFCMMELGLRLAQICDRAVGDYELEQSLLESCAAKGRLIHYHSSLDGLLLKENERSKRNGKRQANIRRGQEYIISKGQKQLEGSELNLSAHDANSCGIHSNLWQQWHYDYGIFTVLTAPFFLMPSCSLITKTGDPFSASCFEECPSPTGHTSLQIYDPNKNKVLMVKAPPESFIIQVGESADIISKGKLRSTLHSVYRPSKFENLSRETFVVFLQPAWNKTFSISDYPQTKSDDEPQFRQDKCTLSHEIQRIVPQLSSRLKDGMTFAEFSRETTKQYYGGSGLQSNR
ncbi:Isopenicillin N synthase-like [Senna tora]|uniref:Isopenicillin N synthase-like n=1 Tax=Senna tora TaxID=362788 RepID=A0A834TA48_9FABA|nr:Isopenicillin N synthase-like [Senna tora]